MGCFLPIIPEHAAPNLSRTSRGANPSLTMFADYRVPQILHHLKILSYPSSLVHLLREGTYMPSGSTEELSLRAASIVAVEHVREEIMKLREGDEGEQISSVVIDFFLWDLAKRIERGEEKIEGIQTDDIVPCLPYKK